MLLDFGQARPSRFCSYAVRPFTLEPQEAEDRTQQVHKQTALYVPDRDTPSKTDVKSFSDFVHVHYFDQISPDPLQTQNPSILDEMFDIGTRKAHDTLYDTAYLPEFLKLIGEDSELATQLHFIMSYALSLRRFAQEGLINLIFLTLVVVNKISFRPGFPTQGGLYG